jgi:tripartite-type tricarboxylate transporter receptor subunit TctC
MIDRRLLLQSAAALLPALAAPAVAQAQAQAQTQADWKPNRPVRLVLPFAAGGVTDILARQFAEMLTPRLGQSVVVENRAGAGGNLAAENVARAMPDGTSLLVATQGIIAINKALYSKLAYDPDADFVPLGMLGRQPNLLVVNKQAWPTQGLKEILASAATKQGGLSYGSNGAGSFTHLSMELLRSRTGVPMTHIPYRGSAPMLTDLMAGRLDIAFDGLGTSLPQVKGGDLRAVAVSSAERSAILPEVPPVSATVPGFDATPWYGVFGATATPAPILQALEGHIQAVLSGAEWQKLLVDRQVEAMPGGRALLTQQLAKESASWRTVVRDTGATAD